VTDRHSLAAWSLELDDARFAQALAALGALNAAARRRRGPAAALLKELALSEEGSHRVELIGSVIAAARNKYTVLEWLMPALRMLDRYPSSAVLAEGWAAYLAQGYETNWGTRLAVLSRAHRWDILLPQLKNLKHPAVGAESVFVADAFASDGRIDWQLPFHFAALPDDPLAEAFAAFQADRPELWPYRFTMADRSSPRVEILVASSSLRQIAGRLLSRGAPSRAALILLLGGMETGNQDVENLVRIIARELAAEGVVCVTRRGSPDTTAAMKSLKNLGDMLTHNFPLDVALKRTFVENATALLSRDMLRISHLAHGVERLEKQLGALPENTSLAMSERTLDLLMRDSALVRSLESVAPGHEVPQAAARKPGPLLRVSAGVLARGLATSKADYRFIREGDEASSLTEVEHELKSHEAARMVEMPETRFIQHSFWRKVGGQLAEERQRLVVGTPVLLRVRIGPPNEHWQSAPVAFPAHKLSRNRQRHRLQVVFHEPTQLDSPMVGELMLPRAGPSSVVEFVFTPREPAAFEGRIAVLHRGRVLQTVLIRTQVALPDERAGEDQAITQQIEARVREHWSDLGSRRRFDASFVLNHTNDNRPLLTGVSGKRAWATDLSGIKEPVDTINQLLSDVAHSVADYGEGLTKGDNPKLFFKLARLGGDLYSALVIDHLQQLRGGGMDVEEATHIQIISTRADAVVPFEFIYQYEPPDDENDVRFCPNVLQALASGACPGNCDGQRVSGVCAR
jgi:hypothetical protein